MGIVKQIIEDRELSFWDHLDVLRWMLFRVIVAWVLLAVGFFIIMPDFFDKIILAPCYSDFVLYDNLRWIGQTLHLNDPFFTQDDFQVHLQNINLASQFFVHITTSFLMAVVVTAPYLVYEIWRFVRPALYPNELKGVRKAFSLGTVFFFLGVAVGYFVIFPLALRFLSTYQLSTAIENEISLNSYIDNFMMLVLMMGVAFELPLVTWLLSLIGLVTRSFLREYRRHAILLIVIFAAIITPTGDPFTLSAVSLPLYLLYELSIFMVKDKKEDDEDEEEEKKEEKPADKKDQQLLEQKKKDQPQLEQKNADQKALPSKNESQATEGKAIDNAQALDSTQASKDDAQTSEGTQESSTASDGESAEETDQKTQPDSKPTVTTAPEQWPEENEFTPECAPEYEDEYYLEDDQVKVRQVPKEKPAETTTIDSSAKDTKDIAATETAVTETAKTEVAEKASTGKAAYEQLYKRPEDQFVDAGDDLWGGYGFAETMPITDDTTFAKPLDAPVEIVKEITKEEFLENARAAARAAQSAADAAAQLAKQAAEEAAEAAKRAAEAAQQAIRKAEEIAAEMARREALEEAQKNMKPRIDVTKIFYDVDSLPKD